MKPLKNISKSLSKFCYYLEYIIGIALILCVVIQGVKLFFNLGLVFESEISSQILTKYLSYAFNLVIVLEFVRMLIKHSMENVTEVLIFTIARTIIIDHVSDLSLVLSILSIIALLATRKYLLVKEDWQK